MKWSGSRLRSKLLVADLFLIVLGVATFFLAALLVAPTLFEDQLGHLADIGVIGESAQKVNAELKSAFQVSVIQAMVVATAVGSVAAVAISVFVSDRVSAPLRHMADAAKRIAAGKYTERVPNSGPDPIGELSELARSFNEMAASLENMERRRMELLGDLAHELRTPISTLEGYTEGLLDGMVESSPETWARLHDEASRLRRLVADLQELSRAEARQLSLDIEALPPALIIQNSIEPLRLDFEEKGLEIVTEVAEGLPLVSADMGRAMQVLTNLLTNALRYTPAPGLIEVSAARNPGSKEVLFQVRDTGIGIPREHLANLFERFYRVDKSRSRAAGGSGIGLTIARSLVQMMGGRIWVESPGAGQGSTFSFTLPSAR